MDKSIGRQTMIFKVSWQTGFLLLVVRWVSSQTGFIVDKSGLTRQNSVCCWWTVPSQDSWRLCLICSCKRDGMTEYVGKQPCLVKDRMLCRQTSLMTGKSCFFIKSVLTRQKVVTRAGQTRTFSRLCVIASPTRKHFDDAKRKDAPPLKTTRSRKTRRVTDAKFRVTGVSDIS